MKLAVQSMIHSDQFVALYIRVSTDEQAEHGFSIEFQKDRLVAYCASQGWTNYRFYIDEGYSGTTLERPAMQRLMKHIREKKVSTVVVYRLDRLSRKQKDVLYMLEDIMEPAGCHFKSSSEPFDTSSPFGKAMIGILAVFAQLERDTIVERTTDGRRKRIKDGLWPGGRVPFGHRWNKKKEVLELDHDQAALLREAGTLLLRKESALAISEYLATKTSDRVFDHNVVIDMLSRPINVGLLNQHDGSLVEAVNMDETIFDMETYTMILKEIESRKGHREQVSDDKLHLLSGILECGVCCSPMYRYVLKQKKSGKYYEYVRYACVNQHVRKKDRTIPKCHQGYKDVKKLDASVVELLKRYALSSNLFQKELSKLQETPENYAKLQKEIQAKLKSVDDKLERWYEAFEEGNLDPRQLKKRIDQLEEEKRSLQMRLDEIEDAIKEKVPTDQTYDAVTALAEAWDEMSLKEQQAALRLLIDKVVVQPDWEIQIKWAT